MTQEFHSHISKIYGIFFISIACNSKKFTNLRQTVKEYMYLEISKPPSRSYDLIEGLKELSKVVILMVIALAGYKQIKISNWKKVHNAESRSFQLFLVMHKFPVILSQWHTTAALIFPSNNV